MHETLISLNYGETEKNFSPFNLSLSSFLVWTDPLPSSGRHRVPGSPYPLAPRASLGDPIVLLRQDGF